MSNTSNFREAFREAKTHGIVGPNVIANALPYVGGGLVLTALGTYGGLGIIRTNPGLFLPTFFGAVILELILFFVAQNVASKGNKALALPLLSIYSLLSGLYPEWLSLCGFENPRGRYSRYWYCCS